MGRIYRPRTSCGHLPLSTGIGRDGLSDTEDLGQPGCERSLRVKSRRRSADHRFLWRKKDRLRFRLGLRYAPRPGLLADTAARWADTSPWDGEFGTSPGIQRPGPVVNRHRPALAAPVTQTTAAQRPEPPPIPARISDSASRI